jgi:hypothetical protein
MKRSAIVYAFAGLVLLGVITVTPYILPDFPLAAVAHHLSGVSQLW